MLLLSRSDLLWPEFPPFMLDVQRPEAPAQNSRNQTIRFQEPNGPVLSGSTTVKGATGLQRGAPPPVKRRLDGEEA
jgi:hypothetical protein